MGWLKAALSWGIAAGFCVAECLFHWQCGFGDGPGKSSEELSKSCTGASWWVWWAAIPDFTEAVCRCGVALALAGLLWETARAAREGQAIGYLRQTLVGDDLAGAYGGLLLGGFTLFVGLWSVGADGELPRWADIYLHLFEALCAMMVVACLAGLLCDFLLAVSSSNTARFLQNLVLCGDNLDDHAHWSGDAGPCRKDFATASSGDAEKEIDVDGAAPQPQVGRAIVIWLVFLFVLSCMLHNWVTGHRHRWIMMSLDVFGVICISGIAFTVVKGAFHVGATAAYSISGRNLACLAPTFSSSETSERDALLPP